MTRGTLGAGGTLARTGDGATTQGGGGRRFRLVGVLGSGGYGRVYAARMEGADGFVKPVALKLLYKDELPEHIIQRFRDEARLLGLLNDRAIVKVDPPTRLDGRWAIVMELVEGATLSQLIGGAPIPPKPALAIVGEIARALDKVYRQPGEDQQPLQLVHRDVKTSNVAVTADGDVKILDFGIARARFSSREAETRSDGGIFGTEGYIAPERFDGIEGPEGDVYSLGVTLYVVLTRNRPAHLDRRVGPGAGEALKLAIEMCELDPKRRPTARQVAERCMRLVATESGPTLQEWAATAVPAARTVRTSPARAAPEPELPPSSVLTEATATGPTLARSASGAAPVLVGSALGIGGLAIGGGLLLAALLVGFGTWLVTRGDDVPVASASALPPIQPGPTAPAPTPTAPAKPTAPEPRRAAPRPAPTRATPPSPARAPAVTPAPSSAAPVPEIAEDKVSVRFVFDVAGVTIRIDGTRVGAATGTSAVLAVPVGQHEFRFEAGGRAITRSLRIGGSHGNTLIEWKGDQLLACRPAAGQRSCLTAPP